jgi:DNA polymerase-3 subunit delta
MPNIKLFYGDEDFLIDKELTELKKSFTDTSSVERIDGSKADIGDVIAALSSMPMFSKKRLVIIDGLNAEDEDEENLFNTLKNLSPDINAVFVEYGSVDKRKKFYKQMEKIAEVKEFKSFTEWEQDRALAWVVVRVKEYGKKISGRAATLLIEIVGLSLRMLDKEIEKISTFTGKRDMIEEADVRNLASSGEMDSFALSNALREKNTREAMVTLNRLFKDNEDPHMMIGMLAKLYRMLLQVKCLEAARLTQFEIAGKLKAKPFFVKKCMESTSRFSLEELKGIIKKLHEADLKLKSGSSPRFTLEMLIPELCHGK